MHGHLGSDWTGYESVHGGYGFEERNEIGKKMKYKLIV